MVGYREKEAERIFKTKLHIRTLKAHNSPLVADEITSAVLVLVAISLAAAQLIVVVIAIAAFHDAVVYIVSSISYATRNILVITMRVDSASRQVSIDLE